MKEILVPIQVEGFCPDGCLEISPIKNRDNRLICINSDRCKNLWKMLKKIDGKQGQENAPAEVAMDGDH